ncbi:MAG: glutamate--cysteine ligase [Cyclobacteriaceae bacterium]|jgi:gamma-glutamyl:cysteine ligase YbdK (ATP-grasp superfamily)|nr:glutamate--cysteine ligase [Cyclobacteriaceae bacterium]
MTSSPYHLFDGFGIELEYMIVDKNTLQVKSIADELLKHELGSIGSDFENGLITWSNELVLHVIEIKSTRPEADLQSLEKAFAENVIRINKILEKWNAMLLPTAAHPFMNPFTDTKLWPHDNNEVYALYDKLFDSKGHGWSNLQSTHLNLPFHGDEEFAKLHAAIRLILPLLPALCASSPILDSRVSGMLDTRLKFYKTNQAKIPAITGSIIPEEVYTFEDYKKIIYQPIEKAIAPHDAEQILDSVWVNSRGAIARFDRGSIEIRVMDIQECPAADLAIVTLVVETLKLLISEKFTRLREQKIIETDALANLFDRAAITGLATPVENLSILAAFGLKAPSTIKEIWKAILINIPDTTTYQSHCRKIIETILEKGSLSERILHALKNDSSIKNMETIYHRLGVCLQENKLFI